MLWWAGFNLENLGSFQYWPKWAFFWKKGTKTFTTSYSIPFLSVSYRNKTLNDFHKHHLTVVRIRGLDQGLMGRPTWSSRVDKWDWVHCTYCYGQALQLADGDTIKAIKITRGSLDTAFEITKVIKCFMFLKS